MRSQIEFNSYVKNGTIAIPEDLVSSVPSDVYVIIKPRLEKQTKKISMEDAYGIFKGIDTHFERDEEDRL